MVKVLPEPVTPSSTCERSWRLDAFDQIGDRLRLVALGVEIGFDDEPSAALAFLRPFRPMRHPDFVGAVVLAEFRPAFTQQFVERLLAGKAGDRADFAARRAPAQARRAHVGRDHIGGSASSVAVLLVDAEGAGEIRIELAGRHRRLAHVTLLRRFAESAGHRRARPMGAGEIGAAIE